MNMWNKVVIGGLMTVLIGGLTIGAVNRTSDSLEKTTEESREVERLDRENADQNYGRGRAETDEAVVSGNRYGALLDTESNIQGNTLTQVNGQRGGGQGGSEAAGAQTEEVKDWFLVQGTVISVSEEELVVELTGGEQIIVEGRAWSFSQELNFVVKIGDRIQLDGFFEEEEFVVGGMENITTGQLVELREESGRPLWAGAWGRGRREA
jgi:hypothetical protein